MLVQQEQRLTKVPGIILTDGAGTLFDRGSRMPIDAMRKAFERFNMSLDDAVINSPGFMGLGKREHIQAILNQVKPGQTPDPETVDKIHSSTKQFLLEEARKVRQIERIEGNGVLLVSDALMACRIAGIKVVLTTGYDRQTTNAILETLPEIQRLLDGIVTRDDVKLGRPAPDMNKVGLKERCGEFYELDAFAVGDTRNDLIAADNANISGILLLSGAETRESAAEINRNAGKNYLVLDDFIEFVRYAIRGELYGQMVETNLRRLQEARRSEDDLVPTEVYR